MKKILYCFIIALSIILMTLSGCNQKYNSELANEVGSYSDLNKYLIAKGYNVEEVKEKNDEKRYTFLTVYPKYIKINETDYCIITVYEFKDSKEADAQAATISEDGYKVGNAYVEWASKPYFYKKENLIVSYIGTNKKIILDLKAVLGNPITK